LQKKWRVNRVTEIEQLVWACQSIEQDLFRHSDTTHGVELMRTGCRFLIEQTIATGQSMCTQLPLEVLDSGLIGARVICRGQEFEPNRVEFQSMQTQHPLQRNGKISAAFAIFCGEPAPKKNCHASRIVILLARSSSKGPNFRRSAADDLRL